MPLRARQDEFEPNEQYEHASMQSEADMHSSIAYLGELLREALSIMVDELQEPLDGALVADCYSSQASIGAKNVELGLEVFTRGELANWETRANIHDSVVQHMALDVEMVMIVQRLRLSSVTSVHDPLFGSTAIVSGSVARQCEKQTDYRAQFEELRMDGLLPRPTWTPLTDSAHWTLQKPKRFGCEKGDAFGLTVIHPNGERLFLLARPEEARHSPRAKTKGSKTRLAQQEPAALKVQFALFERHVRDSLELLA
ncbi:hypothetical protein CYMTET_15735 [Cymbomonas tetramitiformis]|uniref:Uncharacterized protein n=2 Tax=Cymbomonas tetramitiformis TaxID=36881 RepID=A0AAE0GDM3_9CHLO|nr:hypothetical protein CYMTET_15735 [Cymbomonas tetramitiformis]